MADLVSTVPYVWKAFVEKTQAIASAREKPVPVFQYQIGQYQPPGYVFFAEVQSQRWEWENIGAYSQNEYYEIVGSVSYVTGRTPNREPVVAQETMEETYALFNELIMTPAITNRNAPVLGNAYSNPGAVWRTLPTTSRYTAGPLPGQSGGFYGQIDWGWEFAALITPH